MKEIPYIEISKQYPKSMDWEERLSLEYGNKLISYRFACQCYKRNKAFETIKHTIPIIAALAATKIIMGILMNDEKVNEKIENG